MFKKFFGKGEKKQQEAPPPPAPVSIQISAEKSIVQLNQKIAELTDQVNKFQNEAEVKATRAKELMELKKRKQAKVVVNELAELKNKIETINTRKKVLRAQRTQVQTVIMDMDTAKIMGQAVEVMKKAQDLNQIIHDIILDMQEYQNRANETNLLFQQMAANSELQEQAEDLFAQLQREVDSVPKSIIQQPIKPYQIPVKTVQVSKATTATTQSSNMDDLSKWINN